MPFTATELLEKMIVECGEPALVGELLSLKRVCADQEAVSRLIEEAANIQEEIDKHKTVIKGLKEQMNTALKEAREISKRISEGPDLADIALREGDYSEAMKTLKETKPFAWGLLLGTGDEKDQAFDLATRDCIETALEMVTIYGDLGHFEDDRVKRIKSLKAEAA